MLKKLLGKRVKHTKVTIKDLLEGKDKVDGLRIPIIMLNTTPPSTKIGKYVYGGNYTISEKIILSSISKQGPEAAYISFVEEKDKYGRKVSHYVPMDLEVGVLTGSTKQSMLKVYEKNIIKNLHLTLAKVTEYIGSDPEIFVEKSNGELLPAFDFLKGKKDPKRDITVEHCGVYWDGFQAEFETKQNTCLAYHTDSVYYGLRRLLEAARKVDAKAKLSIKTVMEIPKDLLNDAKEEHVQLGCMPSLNAYGLTGESVTNGRELIFRSAGGHIHFSTNAKDKVPDMVKGLDAILGVACVAMFANYDNPMRRRYYGQAGEYRLPAHGFEYRTLSNAWLVHPFIMNLVFDTARLAASFGYNGHMKLWKATEQETIECINTCNVKLAQEIMDRNKEVYQSIFKAAYPNLRHRDDLINKMFEVFYDGMDKVLANPDDVETNWSLSKGSWQTHGEEKDKSCHKGIITLVDTKKKLA